MQNRWMDRVSDYVDGTLDAAEQALFEERLVEDEELRRAVAEVESLVARAAGLGPVEPPRDLWPSIAARIGAPAGTAHRPQAPAPRPRVWKRAALIAAGLAVMVVSASAGWWLHEIGAPRPDRVARMDRPGLSAPSRDAAAANFADQEERLGESIQTLEEVLARHGSQLDMDTQEAIAQNLALIDAAIEDAHRALLADPNSDFLHSHITATMERKVRLLEDAARLASKEI